MKKFFSLLAVALLTVSAAKADYTLAFPAAEDGKDSSTAYTAESTDVFDATYVAGIVETAKCFPGIYGIKFSSGSADGYMTLALTDAGKVTATGFKVEATPFKTQAPTLTVNGKEIVLDVNEDGSNPTIKTYEVTLDEPTALEQLELKAVKRLYVKSVTVVEAVATGIENVEASKAGVTYDLQGRQVQNAKGLVIRNGQKVIIR
jgi:hypothetical protein